MLNKKVTAALLAVVVSISTAGKGNIPLPYHASKEVISTIEVMEKNNKNTLEAKAIPKDADEWKMFIKEFDSLGIEQGINLADELGVHYKRSFIGGVEVFEVSPSEVSPKYQNNLFLHIHGGAWIFGGEESALREAARIAHELKVPVISVNYRKAPDHPAPAAVNDVITVWSDLISKRPGDTIIMGGTSAGGNLTAASAIRMRDLGLPMPAALFIGTPAADVLKTTDSRFIMDGVDAGLGSWDGLLESVAELYYGDLDPKDPYISPIYGDFSGFPPAILVSGTRDLMLSDTVLIHRAIRDAGSQADLHIYEGHSHGFYLVPGKDLDNFYSELDRFADSNLKRYEEVKKSMLTENIELEDILISEEVN